MLIDYALGQQSIILRIKVPNSAKSDNSGVISINNTTTGLVISTICDCESIATSYSSATATISNITTLGTYVAPATNCCNFRQVDPINHPGIYEIQLVNARYAVIGAKSLILTILSIPAANFPQVDVVIPLRQDDPYLAKPFNFNLLDIDASGNVVLQETGLDQIIADGYTARQALFLIASSTIGKITGLPNSPVSIYGLNGVNVRILMAFDANSNRLSSIITPP
jgi:hypothetical protein